MTASPKSFFFLLSLVISAPEDEWNLVYVAMSRAKKNLFLSEALFEAVFKRTSFPSVRIPLENSNIGHFTDDEYAEFEERFKEILAEIRKPRNRN